MSNTALLGSFGAQDSSGLMFRNVLVNGCFRVWQRGTSQTSAGYGSDDRWVNDHSGSTKTHSQQTFTLGQTDVPGNPIYFSRTVVTSVAGASNFVLKTQRIESVRTFSGQTATLSFWAKADAPKNMAIEFVQSFGTGGSPSAAVTAIGVTTCALTASWKQFTITVSVPSISGKTLGTADDGYLAVNFWFDGGSAFNARTNSLGQQSGTFDIAQVQLEAGPTATPFERRPLSLEVQLAQRYFQVVNAPQYLIQCDANQFYIYTASPVKLRASPSTVKWLTAAYLHRSGEVSPVTINTVANTTISPNPGYDNFDFSIGHTIVFDSIYTFAAGQYVLNQSPTAGNLYSAQVYISVESEL